MRNWRDYGSQNAHQSESKIDLKIDEFWSAFLNEIWMRKWSQNGVQKLPKMKPKLIEISCRILLSFRSIFARFSEAPAEARTLDLIGRGQSNQGSGLFDRGSKNRRKGAPKRSERPPETKPGSDEKIKENLKGFRIVFGARNPPKRRPGTLSKCTRNPYQNPSKNEADFGRIFRRSRAPKTVPRTLQEASENDNENCSVFGPLFYGFWTHFGVGPWRRAGGFLRPFGHPRAQGDPERPGGGPDAPPDSRGTPKRCPK